MYANHEVRINRAGRLRDEPHTGHNRWHPEIPPILEVAPGETVYLETRDAADGQVKPGMTVADLDALDSKVAHPVTGPLFVRGAEPGDLLEVEFVEIVAQDYGWTRIRPGSGFLREHIAGPFLAHWHMSDGWAQSVEIPNVRIPEGAFMGTSAVAPSHAQLQAWRAREQAVADAGGIALGPDPQDAVPAVATIAAEGLRTIPPRENGGNIIRANFPGSRLFLPVSVGALFSTGDAITPGALGCCITAIESCLCAVLYANNARAECSLPEIFHTRLFVAAWAAPFSFIATTGMPIVRTQQQWRERDLAAGLHYSP